MTPVKKKNRSLATHTTPYPMQDGVPQRVRGGRSECAGDVMRDFRPRDKDHQDKHWRRRKKISRYWGFGLGLSSLGVGVLEISPGVFFFFFFGSQLRSRGPKRCCHIVEAPTFTCLSICCFFCFVGKGLSWMLMDVLVLDLVSDSVMSTPKLVPRKHLPRGRTCRDETTTRST